MFPRSSGNAHLRARGVRGALPPRRGLGGRKPANSIPRQTQNKILRKLVNFERHDTLHESVCIIEGLAPNSSATMRQSLVIKQGIEL